MARKISGIFRSTAMAATIAVLLSVGALPVHGAERAAVLAQEQDDSSHIERYLEDLQKSSRWTQAEAISHGKKNTSAEAWLDVLQKYFQDLIPQAVKPIDKLPEHPDSYYQDDRHSLVIWYDRLTAQASDKRIPTASAKSSMVVEGNLLYFQDHQGKVYQYVMKNDQSWIDFKNLIASIAANRYTGEYTGKLDLILKPETIQKAYLTHSHTMTYQKILNEETLSEICASLNAILENPWSQSETTATAGDGFYLSLPEGKYQFTLEYPQDEQRCILVVRESTTNSDGEKQQRKYFFPLTSQQEGMLENQLEQALDRESNKASYAQWLAYMEKDHVKSVDMLIGDGSSLPVSKQEQENLLSLLEQLTVSGAAQKMTDKNAPTRKVNYQYSLHFTTGLVYDILFSRNDNGSSIMRISSSDRDMVLEYNLSTLQTQKIEEILGYGML